MTGSGRRFGTVALTGATSGIGAATARLLAAQTDTLILHGPEDPRVITPLLHELRQVAGVEVHYVPTDFTHLDAVTALAGAIRELASAGIDLLINNAGVPGAPTRLMGEDGYERTLQVNALAPALLTRLLVPSLTEGARIVNVGSSAHRVETFRFDDVDLDLDYTPIAAYARAKLAMVTWSTLLAEEEAHTSTTVVALCPGLNDTPLSAAMMGRVGGSPSLGAARVLHAAIADVPSGTYLEDDRTVSPSAEVTRPHNRERLTDLYLQRLSPFASPHSR
jgi:NAD(P)-dependent dehydrogenase (short-subunit alcohol dehydrogenase family)